MPIEPPDPTADARPVRRLTRGARRYSAVQLVGALLLLFIASPFIQEMPNGGLLDACLASVVFLSALLTIGGGRTVAWGVALALPALAARWLHQLRPETFPILSFLLLALAFVGFVTVHLLRAVLFARTVNHETLCASIATFLMLGLLWSVAYSLVAAADPAAFEFASPGQTIDGFNAFYFSFVTLTTVGFGDITPVASAARLLAVLEAIAGMFYVTILVARLVSVYSSSAPATSGGGPAGSTAVNQ